MRMNVEVITKEDLERFKKELVEEISAMIGSCSANGQVSKSWLKSIEVRKMLGISIGTLQNLRLNGTLPYSKISGLLYYKYEDILKLMEKNNESTPP